MKIVLASSNAHKVKEINEIVAGSGLEFILPPDDFDPIEDGKTFEENSLIKAKAAWELTKTWALADDSGLCIDALNGAPGLYSARYAGTQAAKIERVLRELEGEENRKAKFVCCMTLINEKGEQIYQTTGECKGQIIKESKGVNGFGYDPIFQPDGYDYTIAEMSEEKKNTISHRANAMNNVINFLKSL